MKNKGSTAFPGNSPLRKRAWPKQSILFILKRRLETKTNNKT